MMLCGRSECGEEQFQCGDTGQCLDPEYQCDGVQDCQDGSGEYSAGCLVSVRGLHFGPHHTSFLFLIISKATSLLL